MFLIIQNSLNLLLNQEVTWEILLVTLMFNMLGVYGLVFLNHLAYDTTYSILLNCLKHLKIKGMALL